MKMRLSLLLALVIIGLFALVACSTPASAWLYYGSTPYQYVQYGNVVGSTDGALTNYQVLITVYFGAGPSSGSNFWLDNKMWNPSNCADLRFTDANDTPYSYWIQNINATAATIWIKIPSLPAYPGTVPLRLYYSHPTVSANASNGYATFPTLFDDCRAESSVNTSIWTSGGESWSGGAIGRTVTNVQTGWQSQNAFVFQNVSVEFIATSYGQSELFIANFNYNDSEPNQYKNWYGILFSGAANSVARRRAGGDSSIQTLASNLSLADPNFVTGYVRTSFNKTTINYGVGTVSDTANLMKGNTSRLIWYMPANGNAQKLWHQYCFIRSFTNVEPTVTATVDEMEILLPTANFYANPTNGYSPLGVNFYDSSTGGTLTSWLWNFGDGGTSTLQNPSYSYNGSGIEDITLTVWNANGSNSYTRSGYIQVYGNAEPRTFITRMMGYFTVQGVNVQVRQGTSLLYNNSTDASGRVVYQLVPPSTYNVTVIYRSYTASMTITPIESTTYIEIPPWTIWSGELYNTNGSADNGTGNPYVDIKTWYTPRRANDTTWTITANYTDASRGTDLVTFTLYKAGNNVANSSNYTVVQTITRNMVGSNATSATLVASNLGGKNLKLVIDARNTYYTTTLGGNYTETFPMYIPGARLIISVGGRELIGANDQLWAYIAFFIIIIIGGAITLATEGQGLIVVSFLVWIFQDGTGWLGTHPDWDNNLGYGVIFLCGLIGLALIWLRNGGD